MSIFFLRQIDFLAELALLEGSFTGVGFWYIGLTDLGNFILIENDDDKQICRQRRRMDLAA